MKILVNASTIKIGGAIKVVVNFIKYTLEVEHQFYYLLSKEVYAEIEFSLAEESFCVLSHSPASVSKYFKIKKQIRQVEKEFEPDIVYSVGAPSYIKFKTMEVQRLTNGLMFSKSKIYFSNYSRSTYVKSKLINAIKRRFVSNTHYIITQTEIAQRDISEVFQIPMNHIGVIPNTVSYDKMSVVPKKLDKQCFNILSIGTPYLHKNFTIISDVIHHLKSKGVNNFKFFVTMPPDFKNNILSMLLNTAKKNGFEDKIHNFGSVKISDISAVYNEMDLVFTPSLLEVSSSSHIEAMVFEKPIVTTDLPFSREVCGDAALYYNPVNASMAADKLLELMENDGKRNSLVERGKARLKSYSDVKSIYNQHIEFLEEVYTKKGNPC